MIDLIVCLAIATPFAWACFQVGRAWERTQPDAVVYLLPRHPPHHHRARRVRTHVARLVSVPPFDQDAS